MSSLAGRCLLTIGVVALTVATAVAADDPSYTGVYSGQGRGCWGKLYVRAKTIEWNTPYSVCAKAPYRVIDHDLASAMPRIAFALKRKSSACRYAVVALSFDPAYPAYWQAAGYATIADYESRTAQDDEAQGRTLTCAVRRDD